MADEKDKPVYDEQTLARLLEAAYVLQEHNREMQKLELNLELKRDRLGEQQQSVSTPHHAPRAQSADPASKNDYTLTLAQIVETQHQIQARNLKFEDALVLIGERVIEIANAGGVAIGIADGNRVRYRSAAGSMTLPVGSEVSLEKALCVACLRTGQVIRCVDVNAEFLLDVEECQRRGIQSMIAVPVYHDGGIAGGLELYYGTTQAFTEQDVHTCQLMAGLVTEALARDEEGAQKKALAGERALMLETLEKLKPNLQALLDKAVAKTPANTEAAASGPAFLCLKCAHPLMGQEQFCGRCGTPRGQDYERPTMQSKFASLWQMQEATRKGTPADAATGESPHENSASPSQAVTPNAEFSDSMAHLMQDAPTKEKSEPLAAAGLDDDSDLHFDSDLHRDTDLEVAENKPIETAVAEKMQDPHAAEQTALARPERAWTSAAAARDFLEQVAGNKPVGGLAGFWNARRGDIYLAVAVILVIVVVRWVIWSNHSVSATGRQANAAAAHKKSAADAQDLSTFDRLLISLGLAEAPPPPESKGNPDTQVWVDLHSGLYYCPADDLYGKTPKGKYTGQRDAQLDQFTPAYGKTCD